MEDKYCPFCGLPNEFYQKHQKDMEHFQQEFRQTQSDVYQSTKRFSNLSASITIVFILFLLNIAAFIFVFKSWDIGSSIEKQRIHSHLSEHQENIDSYIKNGDFCGLSTYFNQNSLYYEDSFDKYNALISAAESYRSIYRVLANTSSSNSYYFDEDEISYTIASLTRNLNTIFNTEEEYSYNREEYFTEETNAAITDLRTQTRALLVAYANLTPEEADSLPDLSSKKQKEYLERGLADR